MPTYNQYDLSTTFNINNNGIWIAEGNEEVNLAVADPIALNFIKNDVSQPIFDYGNTFSTKTIDYGSANLTIERKQNNWVSLTGTEGLLDAIKNKYSSAFPATPPDLSNSITKEEDTLAQQSDDGVAVMAVRKDVAGSLVSADGEYTMLQTDSTGALRVTGISGGGSTPSVERNITLQDVSVAGTVSAGANSVAFYVKSGVALINGYLLLAGQSLEFAVNGSDTLASISYDATGGVLLISTIY